MDKYLYLPLHPEDQDMGCDNHIRKELFIILFSINMRNFTADEIAIKILHKKSLNWGRNRAFSSNYI